MSSFSLQTSMNRPARDVCPTRRFRRRLNGSILVYSLFLLVIMMAMISLAMDYGHVQMVKTELQRTADATARGALQMYANDGSTVANIVTPMMASQTYNPVDANSGITPTSSITWGYWTASSKTFTAGSGSPMAVKVVMSRTASNHNAVPLTFPLWNGLSAVVTTCDVSATAIAVLQPATSSTITVPSTADLWLAGMPSGSTAHSGLDNTTNDAAPLALNVTPGATLTFSATGTCAYNNQGAAYWGPDGSPTESYWNQWMNGGSGCQNNIQTINAPANALLGVFLNGSAPSSALTPSSGLDYSSLSSQQQNGYRNLAVQQPFFIGNGTSTGTITQTFLVPQGATRLFLATYDPNNNNDDLGSFTVTTTQQAQVYLVK